MSEMTGVRSVWFNPGRNVREQAQELLERPMVKELDLPKKSGEPARALMKKLGIEY
jgi:hypothetical protein